MQRRIFLLGCMLIMLCQCKQKKTEQKLSVYQQAENKLQKDKPNAIIQNKITRISYSNKQLQEFSDTTFVVLKKIDTSFFYDMKYATADNFLKEQVYDCADCLLRYKTIKQLIQANNEFKKRGLAIKFFDCYRPLTIQKKMWKIFPDKRYVANPDKGSNHNRGTAVDITLVDSLGNELAMGTKFDHFGREAHHAYENLPEQVLVNRKLLKKVMEANGFWSITSEWWHYNLNQSYRYKVSDFKTTCEN